MSSFLIISIVLVVLLIISSYLIYNLLRKVEKYEDITIDQTRYLQSISDIIRESKQHLDTLDENEVFRSDDELGRFFDAMLEVQKELNKYMLPENYGKEEKEKEK